MRTKRQGLIVFVLGLAAALMLAWLAVLLTPAVIPHPQESEPDVTQPKARRLPKRLIKKVQEIDAQEEAARQERRERRKAKP